MQQTSRPWLMLTKKAPLLFPAFGHRGWCKCIPALEREKKTFFFRKRVKKRRPPPQSESLVQLVNVFFFLLCVVIYFWGTQSPSALVPSNLQLWHKWEVTEVTFREQKKSFLVSYLACSLKPPFFETNICFAFFVSRGLCNKYRTHAPPNIPLALRPRSVLTDKNIVS